LIIGVNGRLGLALRESFAKDHEVIKTIHGSSGIGQTALDLGDESSVRVRAALCQCHSAGAAAAARSQDNAMSMWTVHR